MLTVLADAMMHATRLKPSDEFSKWDAPDHWYANHPNSRTKARRRAQMRSWMARTGLK